MFDSNRFLDEYCGYEYDEVKHQLIVDKLGTHETTNIESFDDFTITELRFLQNLY